MSPGDYYGTFNIKNSGTLRHPITLKALPGALLRGRIVVDGAHIALEDIRMDGSNSSAGFTRGDAIQVNKNSFSAKRLSIRNYQGWAVYFAPDQANQVSVARYGKVSDSSFYNISGGISLASHGLAIRNTIRRIHTFGDSSMPGDAFRVFGSHVRILQNKLSGTSASEVEPVHADAVQSWDDTRVYSTDVIVARNMFVGWYNQGVMLENDAWGAKGQYFISNWHIRNNIFEGFTSWGICGGKVDGGIPRLVVQNNAFSGTKDGGAFFGILAIGKGGTALIQNNYVEGIRSDALGVTDGAKAVFRTNYVVGEATKQPRGTTSSALRPSFTPGTLKPTLRSPLVDRGSPVPFSRDLALRARNIGRAVDIGPYEIQSSLS